MPSRGAKRWTTSQSIGGENMHGQGERVWERGSEGARESGSVSTGIECAEIE